MKISISLKKTESRWNKWQWGRQGQTERVTEVSRREEEKHSLEMRRQRSKKEGPQHHRTRKIVTRRDSAETQGWKNRALGTVAETEKE